ncbi:hypothetical protein ABZX85_22115 [Streptomyces sp. NPDC004539]|uniref:hypothetical protein n=1 Tax=Streptomyces sp. NPDC004539 TaxID=3154280 RepID=UPI0033AC05B4
MRRLRTPNRALRALLAEAGWSGARLAREVNSLGAAQGFTLTYDRTTVSHWLSGTRPRPPAPELAAQVLSARIGRRVRAVDAGLAQAGVRVPGESGAELLDAALKRAGRWDVYAPGEPGDGGSGPTPFSYAPDGVRVGMAHVESARQLLAALSRSDDVFGSGAVREPLGRFLGAVVLPWLRAAVPPGVRRELFEVAAQLAYLCGFVAFDGGRHALAQRMYGAAARLAEEAGDRAGRAVALRGLSVQAHQLGYAARARDLAEEAARVGVRYAPSRQHAFFLGQLAVAQAASGDPGYLVRLAQAERCLERAGGAGELPVGAFHPGALALQQAYVHRARGDHRATVRALETSLRHRPPDERRSTAITLADLALTHLGVGHLDRACAAAHTFLDLHPAVTSARVDTRLHTLLAGLRPHGRDRAARGVLERARETRAR